MLPKELRSVATQLDPIQEVAENNAAWRKCWRGLWRLFNTHWYKPREPICLDDEFSRRRVRCCEALFSYD